jgi:hypothetical protein
MRTEALPKAILGIAFLAPPTPPQTVRAAVRLGINHFPPEIFQKLNGILGMPDYRMPDYRVITCGTKLGQRRAHGGSAIDGVSREPL